MSERLQTLTEFLAAARTQGDVFGVVLTPALEALDAEAGAVLLVGDGGDRLEIAATQGYQEGARTIWQDGPLDGNAPAGDALERHEPLFFEQEGELVRAYPRLEARTGGVAAVATAVLPMFLNHRPLGTIILDFKEPRHFTQEETRFLRTLAAQCALALGRMQFTRSLERRVEERTRELEAERQFLHTLLGSLGESIIACDADGRLTLFNGVARELHGLDPEPMSPENWAEHYSLYQADGVTPLLPAQVPLYRAWQGELVENAEMVVRPPDGEAQTVLVNGRPILGTGGERLGAVVAQRDITGRQQQERALATARARAEVLAALGDALQQATTPEQVAELALGRIGPAVGARSMLVVRLEGEALSLPSAWGEVPTMITAYLNQPGLTLRDTPTFQRIAQAGRALYLDDYQLQGGAVPSFPVQAAGVEPIRTPDGTLRGFLIAGRPTRAGVWQEGERDLLRRSASTLGLALERAETAAQLAARSRQIEEEARAQAAFVAFTEAVGTETDVIALAGQAVDVLQAQFPEGLGGYYEREGDLWKLRAWTRNLDAQPEFLAALCAGLPSDTPFIADLLRERAPIFTESWDAERERIEDSGDYGTVAAYPVILGGEVQGFFTMGFKNASRWAERDRAVFRAVGRSLTLALERAEQAARLELQNRELGARTRALEGFADLTRDLSTETDRYTLIRRAQEVTLSLLPEGCAVYFEPEGNRWVLRGQTGELRSGALQAVADAGLPYHEAGNLLIPYTTLAPYYQDQYAQDTDNIGELVAHLGASATLPVLVNGHPRGVFAVVLFGRLRPWSGAERAMMETVVRSLGLALERAEGVADLAQRTRELERSNAELEQFAYIASHDLQAPIRAVTSFAGLIDRRYGPQLDERGRVYLRQIVEGGEHMKRLVDDLLAFSRVHTERRPLLPVDSEAVFGAVVGRLQPEVRSTSASLTRTGLPVVLADAQQLDQLLQNLISNGLKYRREGVTPQVHVSAERDGPMWRFAVSDNGIGIEPQYHERIFVIFQRLHGHGEYEGTGIGLAVCKKIVERHGGRLWLESTPGEGSTFFFTLPEG